MEDVVAVVGMFICLVVGGVASFFVKEAWLERKIRRLEEQNNMFEDELYSYQQKERNAKGLAVQRENKEMEKTIVVQVLSALPNIPQLKEVFEKNPQLNSTLELAKSNPDVALGLVKKFSKKL